MENKCSEIIRILKEKNNTIAFMESCTGGFLANKITNISGASEVLKVSLVTYSNEYKIKFGVDKNIIENYTVYSIETAKEMAKKISEFANSNIGVGVTGELGNTKNKSPKVYYSIYLADEDKYINKVLEIGKKEREFMKEDVAIHVFSNILGGIK